MTNEKLPASLSEQQNKIGEKIIKEIKDRLQFLNNVGLSYLSFATTGTYQVGKAKE